MVNEVFLKYLKEQVVPYKVKHEIRSPLLLLTDGVASHISIDINQFCEAHDIILFKLFPNTSHLTQPCDVSIFKSFKSKWKVTANTATRQNPITVSNFAHLMLPDWTAITKTTGKNGFRKAGIFPWEPLSK